MAFSGDACPLPLLHRARDQDGQPVVSERCEHQHPAHTNDVESEILPLASTEEELPLLHTPRGGAGRPLRVRHLRRPVLVQDKDNSSELSTTWVLVLHRFAAEQLLERVVTEALVLNTADDVVLLLPGDRLSGHLGRTCCHNQADQQLNELFHGDSDFGTSFWAKSPNLYYTLNTVKVNIYKRNYLLFKENRGD